MSPRTHRLARGWAAALIATALAAGSHAVVDGSWPPLILLVLSAALSAPLCMLLAGVPLSRRNVAAGVLISQAMFHGMFARSGHGVTLADHSGHHAAQHTGLGLVEGPQVVIATADHHTGTGMLAAHAVAAAVTYLLLRRGEVAGVRLLEVVSLRVLRLTGVVTVPVVHAPVRRTAWTSPRALVDQLLLPTVNGHRGPPLGMTLPASA